MASLKKIKMTVWKSSKTKCEHISLTCLQMTTQGHSWPLWGCGIYKACTRSSQQRQSIFQLATVIGLIELQGADIYSLFQSSPRKRWRIYLPFTLMGPATALVSEISCMWQTLCHHKPGSWQTGSFYCLSFGTLIPKTYLPDSGSPSHPRRNYLKTNQGSNPTLYPSWQPALTCSSGVSHLRKWILQAEGTTSASED